eukprot:15146609-Alexandrium_andersonii.AAC.1
MSYSNCLDRPDLPKRGWCFGWPEAQTWSDKRSIFLNDTCACAHSHRALVDDHSCWFSACDW